MSGRIDRFKKRKEIIKKNKTLPLVSGVVDQESVDILLNQDIDNEKLEKLEYLTDLSFSLEADPKEVKALLSDLKNSFNEKRLEQILEETKNGIISSIAGPFGLGKVISAYDKTGGNVTTIHNFEQGIIANDGDRERFDEWKNSNEKLDRSPYDQKSFNKNKKKEIFSNMNEGEEVKSGYSGRTLGIKNTNNIDKKEQIDLEHITSVKEIETSSKNHLFSEGNSKEERLTYRVSLAQNDSNLTLSEGPLNSSKGDKDLLEWSKLPSKKYPTKNNSEAFGADPKLIEIEYKKSKDFLRREQHLKQFKKQAKETVSTGVDQGFKMGAQQAFGVLLVEFFSSSFVEIRNSFNKGLEGEDLYKDIKIRLERIGRNIAEKWKDIIHGFSDGFISGFISNLITTIVNMFVTTAKRLVRMIREGVFSLLKALKLIIAPPADMTYREAVHEAMKLIAAGGIVVAGVALEEIVEKLVLSVPFLVPFAAVVTAVIVGSLTAIAMSLITYLIDKMDILGVIKVGETKYILNSIDGDIVETLKRCESVTEEIDGFLYQNTPLLPAGS